LGCRGPPRKLEEEGAAFALLGFEPQLASVPFDDSTDDGKTQAFTRRELMVQPL